MNRKYFHNSCNNSNDRYNVQEPLSSGMLSAKGERCGRERKDLVGQLGGMKKRGPPNDNHWSNEGEIARDGQGRLQDHGEKRNRAAYRSTRLIKRYTHVSFTHPYTETHLHDVSMESDERIDEKSSAMRNNGESGEV